MIRDILHLSCSLSPEESFSIMTKLEMAKKYAFENGKYFSHLQMQKVLPLHNGYLLAVTENKRNHCWREVKGQNFLHMHIAYGKNTTFSSRYRKVASSSLSWLVAHFQILRSYEGEI